MQTLDRFKAIADLYQRTGKTTQVFLPSHKRHGVRPLPHRGKDKGPQFRKRKPSMSQTAIFSRAEVEAMGPVVPEELSETGVAEGFLCDLALKHVAMLPEPTTKAVAEQLHLPRTLAEELFKKLYREKLIEVRKQNHRGARLATQCWITDGIVLLGCSHFVLHRRGACVRWPYYTHMMTFASRYFSTMLRWKPCARLFMIWSCRFAHADVGLCYQFPKSLF